MLVFPVRFVSIGPMRWVGLLGFGVVAACGSGDAAVGGSGGDGSSSGHASDDGTSMTAVGTSDASDGGPVDATGDATTGATPSWCVQTQPIAALADLDAAPLRAHTRSDGRDVVWRIEQTWDPFTKILHLQLLPHTVDGDGIASPGAAVDVVGLFERFADIDGDGLEDVVTSEGELHRWRAADGEDGFAEPVALDPPAMPAIASFDADGDGDLDVFTRGEDDVFVVMWSGDGQGAFTPAATLDTVLDPSWWVDGLWPTPGGGLLLDVVVEATDFSRSSALWRAELQAEALIPTIAGPVGEFAVRGIADFDADGRVDVVASFVDAGVHLWHGIDGGFADVFVSDSTSEVIVADVLGSGAPALLVADQAGAAQVFEAPHDPSVPPIALLGDPIARGTHVTADVDGDGIEELLRTSYQETGYDAALVRVRPCD